MSVTPVSLAYLSRIVGYAVQAGNFSTTSPNLPQRVALLGEMNTANQSTALTPTQITSAQQAATLYGYGSPMHIMARIAFPPTGSDRMNGIPVWAYPQVAAGGAVANSQTITVTGTATANATHTLLIAGRQLLESGTYDINIASEDTPTAIGVKIVAAITAVLGCPVSATPSAGVITTVAKWTGLTSQGITISVLTNGNAAGVSYAIAEVAAGVGTPSITAALTSFGTVWNTLIVNSYGLVTAVTNSLTSYIGNINNSTGQYSGIIMRPPIAIFGSVLDTTTSTADTTFTDAAKAEMANAGAPAPMSLGFPMEAAMNMCVLFANISQNNPNIDVQGLSYPDMPLPAAGNIPAMASYTVRDAVMKLGMSTATIVDGQYQVQDFITTYHPTGEIPPQFRYCRNLMDDLNIKFQFYLLQANVIQNKQIANDNAQVTATNVVKPKDVKAAIAQFAKSLEAQGLIVEKEFMIASIRVTINATNPDRFDISFSYKRSGVVRIVSTTATAGFLFGS